MKKTTYTLTLAYTYDPTHKGAPYTLDGQHWMNNGEYMECAIKSVLGYEAVKDANVPYNMGSDIPELNASVKSSRFTLTNMPLADNFEDSIKTYFETVHSTIWMYGVKLDEEIVIYEMNAEEFESFLREFSNMNERKVIRAKATSTKMLKWFEGRV